MRKFVVFTILSVLLMLTSQAQKKVVLMDISLEERSAYLGVNPQMFDQYLHLVEERLGATFVLNEDQEITSQKLKEADVLIIISTLSGTNPKKSRTATEKQAIVNYVNSGGRLIIFADEARRMDLEAFGVNDIITPFGMEIGPDLPYSGNAGAISFPGAFIKGRYELPYSGSRSLTGGIPISVMNAPGGHVHGAYVELNNGGKVAAFGETMVALFMGGVSMPRPDGSVITWAGKDDKQFMEELIGWMLVK